MEWFSPSLCYFLSCLSLPPSRSLAFSVLFFLDLSDGLYTYKGSDAPEETEDGRPGENKFVNNKILGTAVGVKIKEADNTEITGEGGHTNRFEQTVSRIHRTVDRSHVTKLFHLSELWYGGSPVVL